MPAGGQNSSYAGEKIQHPGYSVYQNGYSKIKKRYIVIKGKTVWDKLPMCRMSIKKSHHSLKAFGKSNGIEKYFGHRFSFAHVKSNKSNVFKPKWVHNSWWFPFAKISLVKPNKFCFSITSEMRIVDQFWSPFVINFEILETN